MSPRQLEASVAVSRMLIDLTKLAHELEPFNESHFGASLEPMFICFLALVATADGKPPNASTISRSLGIPRESVRRHLKALVAAGRLKVIGSTYVANLETFGMTRARINIVRRIMANTATDLSRARAKLKKNNP